MDCICVPLLLAFAKRHIVRDGQLLDWNPWNPLFRGTICHLELEFDMRGTTESLVAQDESLWIVTAGEVKSSITTSLAESTTTAFDTALLL